MNRGFTNENENREKTGWRKNFLSTLYSLLSTLYFTIMTTLLIRDKLPNKEEV
ncbi:MAG: hypothetical protein AB1422_02410 [bacterium]